MKQNLLNLKSWLLMMCLLVGVGSAWATDETIVLANGVGTGSGTSYSITWSGTSCDITQTKENSSTSVSSSYISAPRWYQSHKISFKAKTGYTLTGAKIVCTSDAYATALKNSTYSAGASASVSSSTVTITTSGDFDITMGAQSRISSVTISYTSNGSTPEPTKYNVTIADNIENGTVTASPTSAAEGDEVTLSATPATGYEFGSWNVTDASSNSITVTDNKFTMPAANVNVSATFNLIQGGSGEDTPTGSLVYKKVTSQDDIVDGGVYIIVCENQNTAMGSQNTNRRNNASVTISNNSISLNSINTDGAPYEVTLAKDGDIYKMVLSNNKFLGNGAASSNYLKEVQTYTSNSGYGWTLTYTDNTVTMKTDHTTPRYLCVNTSNTDSYATYASIGSYKTVTLYKKVEGAQEIPNLIKTSSADLFVGDEIADLKTYLNLPNDYAGTVTFSSTSEVVDIDANYLLATAAGTATINVTASAVDGKYLETTGTITLNISKKTPVLSWEADSKDSYTIFNLADNNTNKFVGQTATATNGGAVKYSITGTGATIDADGLVTITGIGESTITAYTEETDALNAATSITYTLTIVEPSITITPEDGIVSFDNPVITVVANGVSGELLNYETEEEKVFDGKSTTTSFTDGGQLGISINDEAENSYEKEFTIKVLKDANLQFSASELRVLVGTTEVTEPTLTKATDAQVTYELICENADNIDKVATIDPVTGKLALTKLSTETQGAVTVKASTPATDVYAAGEATYELVVYRNVPTFTWSAEQVTIDQDELDKLPTPIVQDNRNVTSLTSSNEEVATIVDGAITFVGYGTTTITGKTYATWDYAPATASYELTFAPKYTVTFSVDGEETTIREETTGAGVTAPTVEAVGSYTFDGWTTSEVDPESKNKPNLVSLSEGKYMPSEDITLYAVYKRVEAGEGDADEGEFLIYAEVNGTKYYMTGKPTASGQTVNQVTVTTNSAEAYAYTIAKKEGSTDQYSIAYDDNGVKYLNCTRTGSSSNYSYYLQGSDSEYYFTFSDGAKDGTTRMLSTYSNRAIAFGNNANPKVFKIFSTTNLTESNTQYFDPILEQISGGSTAYYTTSPTYSISIGQYEYATLVVPCSLDFEETGVKAYAVTALSGSNALATEQTKVPASKAIIVHGTPGTYKIPRITQADDFETMLEAKDEVLYYNDNAEYDYYYLGVNNGNVCFKKLTSGSLAAGKCFFKIAKDSNSEVKMFSIIIDDEDATGISSVENMKMNNGAVYNLAGQRVDANTKGIIIVNGKKLFNK